jgi:hypothetical protein
MADFWADKYWNGRYFNTRYFGAGEEVAGAMSASLSGSGGLSAALTFVDNSVVIDMAIDADGVRALRRKAKRQAAKNEKRWKRERHEHRLAVEAAWAKVFGEPQTAEAPQPTVEQTQQVVSIAAAEIDLLGIADATDRLLEMVEAYVEELRLEAQLRLEAERKKRNRDAMIVLLMAA